MLFCFSLQLSNLYINFSSDHKLNCLQQFNCFSTRRVSQSVAKEHEQESHRLRLDVGFHRLQNLFLLQQLWLTLLSMVAWPRKWTGVEQLLLKTFQLVVWPLEVDESLDNWGGRLWREIKERRMWMVWLDERWKGIYKVEIPGRALGRLTITVHIYWFLLREAIHNCLSKFIRIMKCFIVNSKSWMINLFIIWNL